MKFGTLVVLLSFCAFGVTAAQIAIPTESKAGRYPGCPPDSLKVDKMPVVVKQVSPDYPDDARKEGIEGTVYVKCWIDKTGGVRAAEVTKTDNTLLDDAATQAAKRWTFRPARKDGAPVDVWVVIPFRFKLKAS